MMPELFFSLLAGALVGLAMFILAGLFGERRAADTAGIETLAALRWRDFAHLVLEALRREGYVEADVERQPGDSGFDFVLARDGEHYLLRCKQARAARLSRQGIVDFAAALHMQGARGGIIAMLGDIDGFDREIAEANRIDVLDGAKLWARVAPILGQPAAAPAKRAGSPPAPAVRWGFSAVAALGAAGLVYALTTSEPSVTIGGSQTASVIAPAARRVVADPPPSVPVPEAFGEDELMARRQAVVQQIMTLPDVGTAMWSSRSTLVLARREHDQASASSASDEACRILLQYEELRFTRLQIEPAPGSDEPVRWRQCR